MSEELTDYPTREIKTTEEFRERLKARRLAQAERFLTPPIYFSGAAMLALHRQQILYYGTPEEKIKVRQEILKEKLLQAQERRRNPPPDLGPSLQINIIKKRARAKRKRREIRKLKHRLWKQYKGRKRLAEINLPIASSAGGMQDPKS